MTTEREIRALRRVVGANTGADWASVLVPDGIVQFATDPQFLGLDLFPRQGTLLKLITADVDSFTSYDHRLVEEWGTGFRVDGDSKDVFFSGERGTTPDVLDRMRWCRAHGRPWFREIVLVLGRRASKSFLVSVSCAWRVLHLIALGDPQQHYQIPADKPLVIQVFGTDQSSARRDAFGDIARLITTAPCFGPFLGSQTSTTVTLLTPAQLKAGAQPGVDEGSIVVVAAASTRTAGRGPASPLLVFDELGHVQGAGSTADSTDLYGAAVPATAQFDDALIMQSSTAWDRSGQLWSSYENALQVDAETRQAKHPDTLVVQLESPALYVDHERAGEIEMWPGGPHYRDDLQPKVTYDYIERQLDLDPVRARIEWYGQFGTVSDPYLDRDRIAIAFEPLHGRVLEQQTAGALRWKHVGHADPSKSNANFGFAIGHVEEIDGLPHVFFDVIRSWSPKEFPNGIIDYLEVNDHLYSYLKAFRLRELTFDQYSSVQATQELQRRARLEGLHWQPRIYERTATAHQNQQGYELFKTALNAGLIHLPPHDLGKSELESLTLKGEKVVAPSSGPVTTKDVADAIVNVVWTHLHDRTEEIYSSLAGLRPRGSQPGGLPNPGSPHQQLSEFGRRQRYAMTQAAIRRIR